MSGLNSGKGHCPGTARLLIRPTRSAEELGAGPDVLLAALNAVHHLNRHAAPDDFIAVALPGMREGREGLLPGHEAELIGSREALGRLLTIEGVQLLFRRRMIGPALIGDITLESGVIGAAYVRDRTCEKSSTGWKRRREARAERRGFDPKPGPKRRGPAPQSALLPLNGAPLRVRELIGTVSDAPLIVSTYGFSTTGSPTILPVRPALMEEERDAA